MAFTQETRLPVISAGDVRASSCHPDTTVPFFSSRILITRMGAKKPSALGVSRLLLSSRWPDFGASEPDGESAIGSVGRRHGGGPGKVAILQGMFFVWALWKRETFELEGGAACNPVGIVGESLVTV